MVGRLSSVPVMQLRVIFNQVLETKLLPLERFSIERRKTKLEVSTLANCYNRWKQVNQSVNQPTNRWNRYKEREKARALTVVQVLLTNQNEVEQKESK